MISARTLALLAGCFGFTAVVLGAFGAHALKARLGADALLSFETGVRYQLFHAVALLALAAWWDRAPGSGLAGLFFAAGIVLFSGSIYLLATRELTGLTSWRWLGPITPLGGLCFLAGWATVFVQALRLK